MKPTIEGSGESTAARKKLTSSDLHYQLAYTIIYAYLHIKHYQTIRRGIWSKFWSIHADSREIKSLQADTIWYSHSVRKSFLGDSDSRVRLESAVVDMLLSAIISSPAAHDILDGFKTIPKSAFFILCSLGADRTSCANQCDCFKEEPK